MIPVTRMFAKRMAVKSFSTAAAASPRMTIAQNFMVLEQLHNASDEASLAAAQTSPSIDIDALPAGLTGMADYLATPTTSASGFQNDPNSWHYKTGSDYVSEEATRDDTFPFVLSAIAAYLLLGVLTPMAIGQEEAKNSKYISRIEGRFGKLEHGHH